MKGSKEDIPFPHPGKRDVLLWARTVRVGATGLEPVTPSVSRCLGGFHQQLPMSVAICCVGLTTKRLSSHVC